MYTGKRSVRVGTFEGVIDIKYNAVRSVKVLADSVGRGTNSLIIKSAHGVNHSPDDLIEVLGLLKRELEQWGHPLSTTANTVPPLRVINIPRTPIDPDHPPYAKIRAFLTRLFSAESLRQFIVDEPEFAGCASSLNANPSLESVIDTLLDYVRIGMLWDYLINRTCQWAKAQYPGIVFVVDHGYDMDQFRALLMTGFSATTLKRMCRYSNTFREIAPEMSPSSGLSEYVDMLLEWAERRDLLDELARQVEGENPRQYARFDIKR
jgi:hypothetical protein